ncbi:hypothetical protein MNV49_007933 [Pseudohyphozyma bogoriensis]|nr:hypothetical protein MNV49_007933 [Pseudohyphozyma bogoriensis]
MPPAPGPPVKKFTLVNQSLTNTSSTYNERANGSGPLTNEALSAIRQTLVASRTLAEQRLGVRKGNKDAVMERYTVEKKMADEESKKREFEKQKKKESDERIAKEKAERLEREKLERDKEEVAKKRKEEEEYQRKKVKEEEERRMADEREREAAVRKAREDKEREKARQDQEKDKEKVEVLMIVKANEAERAQAAKARHEAPSDAPPPSAPSQVEDVVMEDVKPFQSSQNSPPPTASTSSTSAPTTSAGGVEQASSGTAAPEATSGPSITIDSSPEPDEEDGQPRPPKNLEKKKRKRDQIVDSDASDSDDQGADQPLSQKIKKFEDKSSRPTPSPAPGASRASSQAPPPTDVAVPKDPNEGLSFYQRKLKEEKYIKHSIPTKPPAPGTAQAFYLPSHHLAPPPPISVAPVSTPKKQSEVADDFSKAKPGTQITHNSFHTWVDAYLRPFGEDDLAFLAPKPEDIAPYLIPELGKHYLDRWEEEDSDTPVASTSYVSPLEPPRLPRSRPDVLTEDALGAENVFLGPLSERLIAALALEEGVDESVELSDKVDRDEELEPQKSDVLDAVDLEDRIKRELKFIGLVGEEEVDWASREDDEVSSALRSCQRLLQRQTSLNEARKSILSDIVKDRMAYQDYETTRDAQERVIEAGWTKRYRASKKKGKSKEKEKASEGAKVPVSLSLISAIDKRRKLVNLFRPFFEEEEDVGRYYGIPETSVYADLIEEEEQPLLE